MAVCSRRPGPGEIVEPNKPAVRREAAGRKPLLVAAASGERIWYSHATGTWDTQVALTPIGDPATVVRTLEFPSSRVIHLAAGGGALAVLVIGQPATPTAEFPWRLVVFDETGALRWQVVLPEQIAEPGFSLAGDGFLAISADRVVLRGTNHTLWAWDGKTGTALSTARPWTLVGQSCGGSTPHERGANENLVVLCLQVTVGPDEATRDQGHRVVLADGTVGHALATAKQLGIACADAEERRGAPSERAASTARGRDTTSSQGSDGNET